MFTFLIPRRGLTNPPYSTPTLPHNHTAHATNFLDGATEIKTFNTSRAVCVNGCIDVTSVQIIFVKISVVVFSYYQASSTYWNTQSLISAKFCIQFMVLCILVCLTLFIPTKFVANRNCRYYVYNVLTKEAKNIRKCLNGNILSI